MTSSVRFIVIGTGGMGQEHIRRLQGIQEAEIVALVDPSENALRKALERFPALQEVPTYADYQVALQSVDADAAVIITPHSQHFEQGVACLEVGLHVLMEKPFVSGASNAQAIMNFAKSQGKHLAVAYQRHVQGPYVYLRDLVRSGALGTIQFVSAYQAQAWQKGTAGTWRQDPALSCGGQLNDSGSHLLDVVLWITDYTPKTVTAHIDNRGSQVDIDSVLTVTFEEGAVATFNVVGSSSIDWWEDVSLHGTQGTALYRNGKVFVAKEGQRTPVEVSRDEFAASSDPNRDFVDLILGRKAEAAAPARCGFNVAKLTEAAWHSATAGRPIHL